MCRMAPLRVGGFWPSEEVCFRELAAESAEPVLASASPSRFPSASVALATLPAALEIPVDELEATPLYSIIV